MTLSPQPSAPQAFLCTTTWDAVRLKNALTAGVPYYSASTRSTAAISSSMAIPTHMKARPHIAEANYDGTYDHMLIWMSFAHAVCGITTLWQHHTRTRQNGPCKIKRQAWLFLTWRGRRRGLSNMVVNMTGWFSSCFLVQATG